MKKKLTYIILSLTLLLSTFSLDGLEALATKKDELEQKQQQIQSQKNDVNSQIKDTENKINAIKSEQEEISKEVKRLDFAMTDTKQQIRDKNTEIEGTQTEIAKLDEEIKILLDKIAVRDELLQKRMRALQESGGAVNYLDVLLGASNFSDLITRVTAVTTFLEADKELLRTHQSDKDNLVLAQESQKVKLAELDQAKKELEVMVANLDQQIAEKNKVLSYLTAQEEEIHEDLQELENQESLLKAQESAIKKEIAAWEAAQLAAQNNSSNTVQNQNVSGGIFINPTTGRKTSDYGQRWGTLHSGIDIGKNGRTGDIPIVASASGTVIRANYDRSYGNVVFITHVINGQVYTTVYAHMEKFFVSTGQQVQQGQLLGYMGNTGNSTGPHLHFEIHEGSWNGSRSNSVNPLKYVNY